MIKDNWGRSLTEKQLCCKQLIEGSNPSISIIMRLAYAYPKIEYRLAAFLIQ